MSNGYRSPAEEQPPIASPRWPALIGLRVVFGHAVSRHGLRLGLRLGLRWTCIVVAFLLMPLSLALHGLRNLGGADRERSDAASVAASAWDFDGHAQPGPVIAALLSAIMFVVVVLTTIIGAVNH